ncbi:MAG: hypothetical protein JNM56_37080 [Planctomycetia bacterium]|nr:hypothetical protein [Planctomycetia bacterium]
MYRYMMMALLGLTGCVLSVAAADGLDGWSLVRTVDTDRLDPALKGKHVPTLEKHFTFADGVLRGRIGLGKEFFEAKRVDTLAGVGTIWATHQDWPKDLADFEATWDFQWVMPTKNFADCPFMLVGCRLNADGEGYSLGLHGYTAPLLIQRIDKERTRPIGRGRYAGYIQPGWLHFRLRAAGPIIKAKVWKAGTPEPERWTSEAYDDWSGTPGDRYRQGALAVGFSGVKVFDTASHEFRNIKVRALSADEVKNEASFGAKDGPNYQGDVGGTEKLTDKQRDEFHKSLQALDARTVETWKRDPNLTVEASADGVVLRSTNGAPAFGWLPEAKRHTFAVLQAKASAGARPLLALRAAGSDTADFIYLDPVWREGLPAVLQGNAQHTGDIVRAEWKPDTWYHLLTHRGHLQLWRITEPSGQDVAAFRYTGGAGYGKLEALGIGVAGKGAVTVKGFGAK